MKILKLSSYYYPENVASSHLADDLKEACLKANIAAEVFAPVPCRGVSEEVRNKYKKIKYEELEEGRITVHRFSMFREGKNPVLRAFRYILVNIIQYFKGINAKDIDIVYSASTPPTQGMLCGLVAKKLTKKYGRKVPFVFNLQDIFPDSLVNANMTHEGSFIWKLGRKIEDCTYRHADKIIVISPGMRENILKKGVPADKITVIPNWIDTDEVKPVPKEENRLYKEFNINPQKFTVVYAGNFGASQGADIVIKAAEALKDENDIQFVIFGSGSEFAAAKQYAEEHQLKNVIINALLPQSRVSEVYSMGDAAAVTCKKGVGGSGMPSKVWSIMACNTPVIASFDLNSELDDILHDSGAGVCVEPEDSQILAESILKFSKQAGKYMNYGRNSRNYVLRHASRDICVSRYIELFKNIARIPNPENRETGI